MKTLSQKRWTKGLVASVGEQSQPPGSLQRMSNLLYKRRGSLIPCDGSLIISLLNAALQVASGPWTELYLFQPTNVNKYYVGVKKDYSTRLGTPVPVASDAGAGGVLGAGTYRYKVTPLDGVGGEGLPSAETSVTILANHIIGVAWPAIPNVGNGGYKIYRTLVNGAVNTETLLATVGTGNTNYQDNGSAVPDGVTFPPLFDTTQLCQVFKIPAPSYAAGNIIASLPADPFVPNDGTPGGTGGGGGTTGASGGAPPNSSGGLSGNTSPLPQMVQFANKIILALGNAFAPQAITDGNPPTMAALTNTFTTAYPNWVANALHSAGDVILPTAGNAGNFVFKATQGGASAAAAPVWPQVVNQIVADNGIIWQNTGVTSANIAPRGAAHLCVYAGSLWVLNTSPNTTADNLDGPSCLAMSDTNNPNSWNPLNRAFLDRDDGDFGTAIIPFTIAESGIPPTGSLIAFKNFSTYQINGVFGSSQFSLQKAQTDMGCIAPRSPQFLPGFGIARFAHLGIAIFDGTRDKLISEDIRPYIFTDTTHFPDIQSVDWNYAYLAKGAQIADPPMYVLAVPLALLGLTNVTIASAAGVGTFTAGKYFARVTKFTKNALGAVVETAITQEVTLTIAGTQVIQVTLPTPVDADAIKYRVYVAQMAGVYLGFVDIPLAQTVTNITSLGALTAGNLNVGTGQLTRLLCYDLVMKIWAIIDLPFPISVIKQVRSPGIEPLAIVGGFNDGSVRRIQSGDNTWDGAPVQYSATFPIISGDGATERIYHRRAILTGFASAAALAQITLVATTDGQARSDLSPTQLLALAGNRFLATLDTMLNMLGTTLSVAGASSDGSVTLDAIDHHVDPQPQGAPPIFS